MRDADAGYTYRRRTRAADTQFVVPQGAPKRVPPPWSGIFSRTLDPAIARQIHEIDPHLVVEWVPFGRWWTTPQTPPGATLGCWRIGVRGLSGTVQGLRMWPPDCADGRLVRFLTETWKRNLWKMRNPAAWSREQEALREEADRKAEQARFDAWWNQQDHGALYRAIRSEHESPKWRGGWAVPASAPVGKGA